MLKTKCVPFYADNNSSNLPFFLLQDVRGNDVIYINKDNMIYMNRKDIDLKDQILLYSKCLNKGICCAYKINKDLTLLKQQKEKNIYWILLDKENQLGIYHHYFDNLEEVNFHYNDNYLCLTSADYGDYIPTVVAGYDIKNKKILDCQDFYTSNNLYKAIVEVRRCKFDCIYSILQQRILLEDKTRLYKFLSFILNKEVNDNNIRQSLKEARPYVLKKYPKLRKFKIHDDIDTVKEKNKNFGVNYFYFNRIDHEIDNLKHQENKVLSKKKINYSN